MWCAMPVFRYFVFVGGALLALLLAVDAYLPKPAVRQAQFDIDKSTIRIVGRREGPDLVDIGTRHVSMLPSANLQPAEPPPAVEAQASPREAFAQMNSVPTKLTLARKPAKHANLQTSKAVPRFASNRSLPQTTATAQPVTFPSIFGNW